MMHYKGDLEASGVPLIPIVQQGGKQEGLVLCRGVGKIF